MCFSVPEDWRSVCPGAGGQHRHVHHVRWAPLRHADQQQDHHDQVQHKRVPRLPIRSRSRHRYSSRGSHFYTSISAPETGVFYGTRSLLLHWSSPDLHQHPVNCRLLSQLCQSQKNKLSKTEKSIRDISKQLRVSCMIIKMRIKTILEGYKVLSYGVVTNQ